MHIQLNDQNQYLRTLPTGNVEFSPTVFQPAHTLTPEQCEQFRVYPLTPTEAPAYDPVTHGIRAATPVKVGNDWHQAWEVFPLPAEEVAANQAAAAQAAREQAKAHRQAAVDAIKVTTQAGNTFDGDETSQTRMARAIIALQASEASSVTWVLADNTVIQATAAELTEALALAGAAQAAIWVIEGEQA